MFCYLKFIVLYEFESMKILPFGKRKYILPHLLVFDALFTTRTLFRFWYARILEIMYFHQVLFYCTIFLILLIYRISEK